LLDLLAEAFETLEGLLHVGLLGGPADLDLQLVDRRLQRLLTVLDRALELPTHVTRHATLSLAQSLSADPDRAVNQARRPGPRRRPLLCCHASTSAIYAGAAHLTHRIRMGPAVTSAPERHLIKKYANRKLYDTRTSRYITLEGIAELVRDGHEIKVVDRDSGHDLTQVTLSQVVLSQEKRGPARLVDAGGEVIQERGQALLEYVRKTLNVPSDLKGQMERRREDFEERADEAIEGTLRRLRIPSHTDIDRINARLDRITAQLKKLGATEPAKNPPRKRKAAR
jgi:polyhydroxyalkanoate synthesis repressor PhaR